MDDSAIIAEGHIPDDAFPPEQMREGDARAVVELLRNALPNAGGMSLLDQITLLVRGRDDAVDTVQRLERLLQYQVRGRAGGSLLIHPPPKNVN